jgi:pimeloyl-ACP methyl ester carboxylesterase
MTHSLSPLRFGTARLATGPRVHYAEGGDPDGPALLFLHGWPDSWYSFSRVLPLLPPRYRALAPDQRGFGDSERPAGGYAVEGFAADAVALLDALGVGRATLVGHSFGSFVARQAAAAAPERVDRLVLIGSGASPANPVTRELRASLPAPGEPVPAGFAREFQAGTAHVPLPEPFFERLVAESLKLPPRLWHEVLGQMLAFDDADRLGRIRAPTLLLWGERDALFPREDQLRLAAAIPDAWLRVYANTGHCPNWERPERVAADLAAFAPAA